MGAANWPFPTSAHTDSPTAQKGTRTMAFELESPTQAKLVDVIVLSDKDRAPETNPGVGLDFSMTVANDMLTMFDGGLRSALFCKTAASSAPAQGTLEGVQPVSDMPNLTGIGKAIGQFGWDLELTGYELTLDQGLGGPRSNLTLDDCKLTNWRFKCKEGGSVEVKFRVESPDVNEKTHGKLALLKTREFPILLKAPVVQQQDVEEA